MKLWQIKVQGINRSTYIVGKNQLILFLYSLVEVSMSIVEWETQAGMCQWSTSTFEEYCGCTVVDMPELKEMTEQIDWREKQP